MNDKVVIAILGNRNSGKSRTWNTLFGRTVRTGNRIRRLYLTNSKYVKVFLVSGSPEERNTYVGRLIGKRAPRIALCSMQYRGDATRTIDYFLQHQYSIFIHWLNPGYSDPARQTDSLALISYLLDHGATVAIRNGTVDPSCRVQEFRDFLYGWAKSRRLLRTRINV
jgi:hypothetical protein